MLWNCLNPHRKLAVTLMGLILVPFLLQGCFISSKYRRARQKTVQDILTTGSYQKKIGIAKIQNTSQFKHPRLSKDLHQAIADGIVKNASHTNLIHYNDENAPSFLKEPGFTKSGEINGAAFMQKARNHGFQAVTVAHIQSLNIKDLKKGILWFRKTKRFLHVQLRVTLFDSLTYGMLYSEPKERLIAIDPEVAADFEKDPNTLLPLLEKEITDIGKTIAKEMAEALKKLKWTVSIVSKEGKYLLLPVGKGVGIKVNKKFEVFSGKRTLKNNTGETFVVPGYKKGEIIIETVFDESAKAKPISGKSFAIGDIVAPFPFQSNQK